MLWPSPLVASIADREEGIKSPLFHEGRRGKEEDVQSSVFPWEGRKKEEKGKKKRKRERKIIIIIIIINN